MSYWQSTRHPAPCLLFLAPLLIAYEVGVVSLGGTKAPNLRNGADAWLRAGLAACGGQHPVLAPALVVGILGVWLWRRRAATPGPAVDPPALSAAAFGQVVTYVGAGIYEEVLFRLVMFGGLCAVLQTAMVPKRTAVTMAALTAALLFAAAHHIGPHGEPVDGYNFLFRALAGLYFTLLYQLRGFGVAVGAHACYDVLVGINM